MFELEIAYEADMKKISEAIPHLREMASEFERIANLPKNYNAAMSAFIDIQAFEYSKKADELEKMIYMHGDMEE